MRVAVGGEVSVTLIIGDDEKDVGLLGLSVGGGQRGQGREQQCGEKYEPEFHLDLDAADFRVWP
jgi:hypothetical protein